MLVAARLAMRGGRYGSTVTAELELSFTGAREVEITRSNRLLVQLLNLIQSRRVVRGNRIIVAGCCRA